MADLFLLLPTQEGETALYAWRDRGAWLFADELPSGHSGSAPVAFVAGTAITRHRVAITARRFSEARQAALYAVEDDVAEPVDQLHVALGPDREGEGREVLVASAADMGEWVAWLTARGLATADIVTTHSFLPEDTDALEAPGEYILRADGVQFSIDASLPVEIVKAIAPQGLGVVRGRNLAGILGVTPTGPGFNNRQAWLEWLAEAYEQTAAGQVISLRQGVYAIRRQLNLEGVRRWQVIGALVAACTMLWLATVGLETSAYRDQTETLRAETQRIVDIAVPSANGNVEAALTSLRARQQAGSVGLRPTVASAALYEALGEDSGAEIRSMRYDAATGELTALVLIENYAEADLIASRIEQAGLAVTLGQARQSGNKVLGEFNIGAGEGS